MVATGPRCILSSGLRTRRHAVVHTVQLLDADAEFRSSGVGTLAGGPPGGAGRRDRAIDRGWPSTPAVATASSRRRPRRRNQTCQMPRVVLHDRLADPDG